ncbi:nuclear factor NF-kappa-B p110 subunit isoform X2 [Chironomus tepperi]|uniref:nuclear factor NF-kappa-B p110 subunit isoform X2 n=1 Tax=Chironomus tepperi TaxID=113505 RepID=UPI00391FC40B
MYSVIRQSFDVCKIAESEWDSSFMSSYPYTSPSSRSSTSMDSGHDSPFHTSNVNQNMVDQAPNYYNTNFQCFGNSLGNPTNYLTMPQPYTTSFPSPSISASSDVDKYCTTNFQEVAKPELKIIEQPKTIFRFRYETEMQGPHGMIQAKPHSKNQKVYPTVKLLNAESFDDQTKFLIKCSLYQFEPNEEVHALHPHKLIMRIGDVENCDPHYIEVSKQNDYTAVFQGLGIIQTKRDCMKNILFEKLKAEKQHEQNRKLSEEENKHLFADAVKLIKKTNINQVRLGYTAFMKNSYDNTWIKISGPIYSTVINNKKNAKVGDLKICRMSTHTSEADGNQEVFIFVSKVDKQTIKVRFFETDNGDPEGKVIWDSCGKFSPSDVHHQFGIVFKTPPYKNANIVTTVKVFIQLFRTTDKQTSEPLEFIYKPNSHNKNKRKRPHDETVIPTVVGDFTTSNQPFFAPQSSTNIHSTHDINQNTQHHQQQNQHHENENDWSFLMSITLEDISLNNIEESDIEKYSMDWNNYLGLAIDAPKSMNRDSIDHSNLSILEKLKMIMKLFKEKYDDEKIHEMMMVLIKAAEDRDENLLIDVIQYGTMNDIKELVLILVKYKLFEIFKSKNEIDQNALHLSVNLGYISLIKVLIKFGVDVNETDAFGSSPLHLAVQRNNLAMVQELLDTNKSINMNEFDDNGHTPLNLSVLNNNIEIAKMLISHGGNVLKKNPTNGFTCLHVALLNETINKELIKLLIATDKTLLTLESHEGMNPMELSIKNKLPEDIIELISSFYGDTKEEILDDKCFQELCEIFNKNDSWKVWLIRMDMADRIKEWVNLESPAKALLQYLINTKKTLHDFIELLELTDDDERECALNAIDEMMVRQFSK